MNTPSTIHTTHHLAAECASAATSRSWTKAQIDADVRFPVLLQMATIVCHSNCRKDKLDLCLTNWVFQKIEAAGIRLQS